MYKEIISFWFDEIEPSKWWVKDESFDKLIMQRFSSLHRQANNCELYQWRETALGRLAEVIVLDQFSRNMFRDKAEAFASDALALALSQEAISLGLDKELNPQMRSFLYMPFMHSESMQIHHVAEKLFEVNGIESNYDFEIKHKEIIERFGRYPHRNAILGRTSTPEEIDFLKTQGSSF